MSSNSQAKIMTFVLLNGDELVAEATQSPFTKEWTLTKPLKHLQIPIPMPTPNGGLGIQVVAQLVPAFPIVGNTEYSISADKFLFEPSEARAKLQSAWIQATTGLQIAGGANGNPNIIM